MDSDYNTPLSVGNDFKLFEADLLEDLGVEGFSFLKKLRKKGSLEKLLHAKGEAGLTLIQLYGKNQIKSWAKCKKEAQASAQKEAINGDKAAAISTAAESKGESKVKLMQTWADRMEAMEESTDVINRSAAATNKVPNNGEGSSSSNKGTSYLYEEAIPVTKSSSVHGAGKRISVGEDDPCHYSVSKTHMGRQHAQAKGQENFTIIFIGNIRRGPLVAKSLNGLIAQGLVISGTPEGVIAVHGRLSERESTTWENVLVDGDQREPVGREAGANTGEQNNVTLTRDSQRKSLGPHELVCSQSCERQRAEPRDVSKSPMLAEKVGEAQRVQENRPLDGSKVSPQGTAGIKTRIWFGCNIRTDWNHNGLGFSVLAGPTSRKEASKVAIVFGSGVRPDGNQMNNLEGKTSGIQFGTIPMNFGSQSRWDDLLGSNARGKSKLSFIPPSSVNGKPVIHVKSDQFEHMHHEYKNSLIGSFIGKKSTFEYVSEITSSEWKTKNYTMRPYGEFSFCFNFKDPTERRAALELGSLHIASQLFFIQEWKPFIEAELQELKTIPLWVIFHKFPEELRNEKGYSQVASAIGQPLFADKRTERKETSYARICIEVDAECAFSDFVQVNIDGLREFKLQAEYKWKPPSCKNCKVFGHNLTQCPKNRNQTESKEKSAEVLVWKVKQTKIKEANNTNSKQKSKDVEKNNKEKWTTPAKKHSFKARRVQTCKDNGEGSSIPSFNSMFECLKTTSEVQIEEPTDHIDPAGASIS